MVKVKCRIYKNFKTLMKISTHFRVVFNTCLLVRSNAECYFYAWFDDHWQVLQITYYFWFIPFKNSHAQSYFGTDMFVGIISGDESLKSDGNSHLTGDYWVSPTVTDENPITNSPIDKSKWFKVGQILQSFTRDMESSHCQKKNSSTSLALYSWGGQAITLPRYLAWMVIDNGKINFILWRQMLAEEQMSRNYLLIHTQCKWEEDDKAITFRKFHGRDYETWLLILSGSEPTEQRELSCSVFLTFLAAVFRNCITVVSERFINSGKELGMKCFCD